MATLASREQIIVSVPGENREGLVRLKDFFGAMKDLLSVYFGRQASMARLDPIYRNGMTAQEKALTDADLFGLSHR